MIRNYSDITHTKHAFYVLKKSWQWNMDILMKQANRSNIRIQVSNKFHVQSKFR